MSFLYVLNDAIGISIIMHSLTTLLARPALRSLRFSSKRLRRVDLARGSQITDKKDFVVISFVPCIS